jgi:hypothetical protein
VGLGKVNGCEIGIGKSFDLPLCFHSMAVSWLPDWVWPLLPYWPLFGILLALGLAYRFAGLPGLTAVAGAIGFILGRRSVKHEPVETELPVADSTPSPPKPKKRKTILDQFRDLPD